VLLVGHSQGALDATRIAERGGYRIAGLVTLGGPTGQIPLAATTPVLAVEHAEDPVPALGGLAAAGAAGAARVVVRRSLYADTPPPGAPLLPFSAGAAPHALEEYGRTLALAERSPDPRIGEFQRRIAPFLNAAPGRSTLERVDRVRPPRGRSAGGTRDR
jgi:pimeloyl-ACP methyl ester carboxylesterase